MKSYLSLRLIIFGLLVRLAQLQGNVVRQTVDLGHPPDVDPPPLLVPLQRLPLETAQFTLTEKPVAPRCDILSRNAKFSYHPIRDELIKNHPKVTFFFCLSFGITKFTWQINEFFSGLL